VEKRLKAGFGKKEATKQEPRQDEGAQAGDKSKEPE
jgi:hypothetical protein